MPRKRPKPGPKKRPKKTGPTKRPRLRRALDSKGQQLTVGQRVRAAWTGFKQVYRVDQIFAVDDPDGGRCEIVYCRSAEGNLSQIHLPNLTILRDGPSKSLSFRERLRARAR